MGGGGEQDASDSEGPLRHRSARGGGDHQVARQGQQEEGGQEGAREGGTLRQLAQGGGGGLRRGGRLSERQSAPPRPCPRPSARPAPAGLASCNFSRASRFSHCMWERVSPFYVV